MSSNFLVRVNATNASFHLYPKCPIFIVLPLSMRLFSVLRPAILLCAVSPCIGQWISIGPDGGSAHVLAIDALNPKHLLAGSRGLLLYQSNDAGETWRSLAEFAGPRRSIRLL